MATLPSGETIVAIATPPGRGAIAVVRLSGPEVGATLRKQFRSRTPARALSRRPAVGHFLDERGSPVDEVLVTFYGAPFSYTGEDVGEISCHGSPVLASRIVDTLLQKGMRLAQPGEFTLRAFLSGKIDLTQAEAVRDLVDSQTEYQAKIAAEQLEGGLSQTLKPLREELIRVIAQLEAAVEFVEDMPEVESRKELICTLESVDAVLRGLEGSFRLGRMVHDGVVATITGKPNAGKSSIFNALLREERAIITAVPGTTRDALAETIDLEGIPTRLVDTAGIRDPADPIEHFGIRKARESLQRSDVVLFVVDGADCFGEEGLQAWRLLRPHRYILVVNKADLPRRVKVPETVRNEAAAEVSVSALKGTSLDELRAVLHRVVVRDHSPEKEEAMVTSLRHYQCIRAARHQLRVGIEAYGSGLSEEFPLYDFHKTLKSLGQITGETAAEDILQEIFSTFCIGK